ncbi:MAG TPA: ATP-binding cassette domain-containing protein [Leptospiraceae bacterium]|nr:ATP-binding cassette domain-containing protein [Leptospiraceae bacterium]
MISSDNKIFSLSDIRFERGAENILKNVSWDMHPNEDWLLFGPNGSGKSTLISILFGILWPTAGTVTVFGEKYGESLLKNIQKRIGILHSGFQYNMLQRNLTASEIIGTGLIGTIGLFREFTVEEKETLSELISKNRWLKNPDKQFFLHSDGEKQKILLLRSLISRPELLILDEPMSHLDYGARESFLEFLCEKKSQYGFSSVFITHRLEEMPEFITHALILSEGKTVSKGRLEGVITAENISDVFGIPVSLEKRKGRISVFPA